MADSVRPAGKDGATAVTAVTAVSKAEGVKADSNQLRGILTAEQFLAGN